MSRKGEFAILCQSDRGGREERIAHQVALIEDIALKMMSLAEIDGCGAELCAGRVLPIGGVEFVRRAMTLAQVAEPPNLTYPEVLRPYLRREVRMRPAGSVIGRWFVKPTTTKAFTGFVFDTMGSPEQLSCHDREQYEAFMALAPDVPVWTAEPVRWVSEVRYYVERGEILGEGRYDEGPEEVPLPDLPTVREMAGHLAVSPEAPSAFAIDVGVLECGTTALIEVNDAWALGYYSGTLSPRRYIEMLWTRWRELFESNRGIGGFVHATW